MFYRLRVILFALCCGAVLSSAAAGALSLSDLGLSPYAPDKVLVKFRPGVVAQAQLLAHQAAGGHVMDAFDSIGVQLISVPSGSVPAAISLYQSNPNVLYAEPDYYRLLRIPAEEPGPTPAGGGNYFNEQWYLHNEGQKHTYVQSTPIGSQLGTTQGSDGTDINAPEAWDISIGQRTVVATARGTPKVAVLDSGADCNTLELSGKCVEQVNLVGLSVGYFDYCTGSEPACDNLGHGTFVSSEVAANTDNGEGIAGIGWDTSLGIFKVCYQELVTDYINYFVVGLCPVSGSIAAIEHASQDQLDGDGQLLRSRYSVITMSYGSDFIDEQGNIYPTGPSNAECEAIESAWNNGVVVVAAAGNNGDTGRVYPAACTDAAGESTVIAVAASDHHDDRAAFTTFSWPSDPWVSLSAPGEAIIGILPDAQCGLASGVDSCVDWWDGTSMAAPLVAGGAALVWSDLHADHPELAQTMPCELNAVPCNRLVRDRLQNNAAALGARGQNLRDWTRFGRLDVAAALADDGAPEPPGYVPPVAAFSYACSGFTCAFNAEASTGSESLNYDWAFGDGVNVSGMTVQHEYAGKGSYTVTLTVDDGSQPSSVSTSLNLKRPNQTQSGSVSADSGGGGDSGGNGGCPPKKKERGQC
ncbi:S8 family peptidase [Marinobacterium sediminicola]|uniref:PKD domain-containing protein n=1 Tax=Marinobacterium sediminicola TaxID=518898 RepID=A0ABY1RWR9_9GAMM|nr:S8 family serine peptidase [Marinobacterium sediminicola]ULG70257.1 S8 family serine peptidase [Marinobacterium sediminicola]SMR69926.1 PKD domain-containing protein [Marinobacterium sediminicola]